MVKHFLIDGYNLAYKLSIKITKDNLQLVRDEVRRKVSTYVTQRKCKATLVFDGRDVLGTTESMPAVSLVYTASGESADARIKKIIDETPNKSALCVVSSDNEILRYAKVSRAQTMRSEEFLSHLKPVTVSNSRNSRKRGSNTSIKKDTVVREHKPDGASGSDLEEWKKLFQ